MIKNHNYSLLQKAIIVCGFLLCNILLHAQTLGGKSAYNFVKLPATPLLAASGSINTSYNFGDVGLALNNPSLLKSDLDKNLGLSFNSFFAGIKSYSLSSAFHHDQTNTTFGGGVFFIDYGSINETDATGNVMGSFHPLDYVVQVSAGRKYLERWQYGLSAKFINSNYAQYTSNAVAFDVGVLYADSANGLTASVLVKNMGVQLKSFTAEKEDLPFDMQLGVTKKLSKAPFAFSVTGYQLHRLKIGYNDTTFNNENNFSNRSAFDHTIAHFVFATHIFLGKHIEGTVGFNPLRRQELNLGNGGNGLNGFSFGLSGKFNKLGFQYARSYYQNGIAFNQLGLNLFLNELFGLGTL